MTPEEAAAAMAAWNECGDARGFACRVLAAVMNAMTGREAQDACGAGRDERSGGRADGRNGCRTRSPETGARAGDVFLAAEDGAPACSAVMGEGRWATRRTFSEESAALGFAGPSPAEPMTDGRRRALERRAEQIVSETVERHGLERGVASGRSQASPVASYTTVMHVIRRGGTTQLSSSEGDERGLLRAVRAAGLSQRRVPGQGVLLVAVGHDASSANDRR